MLSFDEFKAINKREQSKADAGVKETNKKKTSTNNTASSTTATTNISPSSLKENESATPSSFATEKAIPAYSSNPPSSSARKILGDFLELQSMQTIYIVLLVLDTFAAFAEVCLTSNNQIPRNLFPRAINQLVKSLRLFSKFNLIIFSFEILMVYVAFGLATVTHFGYMTDFLIITAQLSLDYHGVGRINRLLNVFRIWRPIRLLSSLIYIEREEKKDLKKVIDEKEENIQSKDTELENLKIELSKEKNARESIESMLQNYKEEVDTLNEALKIAAMDIAEVANAEEDILDSENDDDATLSSHAESSINSKVSKLRSAIGENIGPDTKSTFIIHEDGGFEKK
jgi:hypothetical protein